MKITLTTVPDPTDPAGLEGVVDSVQAAADKGFPGMWIPQLPPAAGVAGWDALTTVALAGALVPGVDLGTGVTVAYGQHPFVLARQALTAAAAAHDGVTLGIGVSHRFVVTDMLGYSYDAPASYFREYLEVLNPALAGKPVDHQGRHIHAVGQLDVPGAPVPSVVAAALGPRMLRIAGELTDGVITAWTGPRAVEQRIAPIVTEAAEAAGRGAPRIIVGLPVSVTDDVDAARREITTSFAAGDMPAYRAMLDLEGVDSIADICVFGDEETVAAQIRRFADIGATEFTALPVGDGPTVARTVEFLACL
jgi:F420-dependent oxidoreductase-like protein